jgi:D-glycero-D-manno-heptose 1,7-bisphosphate phosphatase
MTITPQSALFLDRDGVLNRELHLDYVKTWAEFEFLPGVPEAVAVLSGYFNKIFIATNQRGVGRKLMTEDNLLDIHTRMTAALLQAGGRISQIYYCTALNNDHPDRKPNAGMAFRAKQDFPQIELAQSFMTGNNKSDMEFGRNAGLQNIFLTTTQPAFELPHPLVDYQFEHLPQLAHFVQQLGI